MRTKRFLFSALLILILVITGCGVPDIDEVDQASLKSFVLSNTVPPEKPTEVKVVAGQSYATAFDTATNTSGSSDISIVRLDNDLYGVRFDIAADRELVSVVDVKLSEASTAVPTYDYQKDQSSTLNTFDYKGLYVDNNYHFIVSKIYKRTDTVEIEFAADTGFYFTVDTTAFDSTYIDLAATGQTVNIVYEYSTHYDNNASNAIYDPVILDGVPPLISWEEPGKTSDPQAGSPIGYRIFRNFPEDVLSASSTDSDWEALTSFDDRTFTAAAGSSTNIDTRDKTWVHTTDFYGNDTQLTSSAVPRQNWEERYKYRVVTVNEYGNTSKWTAASLRTVPPKTIPIMIDVEVTNEDGEITFTWGYPHNNSVDRDNLDYYLFYVSKLPPEDIAEMELIPAVRRLDPSVFDSYEGDDGNLDNQMEITEASWTLPGNLLYQDVVTQSKLIIPRFHWVEAVDKWGNKSRRTSLMQNRPSMPDNQVGLFMNPAP